MIKQILKQVFAQRASNAWLWVELFLVTIFLWLTIDSLYVSTKNYLTPLGFDISHTYVLKLGEVSSQSKKHLSTDNKPTTNGEDMLTILDRVRNYKGVESACYCYESALPFCSSYMGVGYRKDSLTVQFQRRYVFPEYFKVFRITTPDGKIEPLIEALKQPDSFVITEDAQTQYVGEGKSAVGLLLTRDGNDSIIKRVSAVSIPVSRNEFQKITSTCFINIEESNLAEINREGLCSDFALCIRVDANADHEFVKKFKKEMNVQLKVGNTYLLSMNSLEKVREQFYGLTGDKKNLKNKTAIAGFLLINIFLGIIGTFWFRTSYRKPEMGLRLALGSTRSSLRMLLIVEGVVLLTLAVIPATVVCYNIGIAELVDVHQLDFTLVRFISVMLITYLLMAAMIILGIWYPARQAMRVQPAEVLHEQ